jgi:hypothetical protein
MMHSDGVLVSAAPPYYFLYFVTGREGGGGRKGDLRLLLLVYAIIVSWRAGLVVPRQPRHHRFRGAISRRVEFALIV